MAANLKTEGRSPKAEPQKTETGAGRRLLTSRGAAAALGVSLRTVERMVHDETTKPVRLHGRMVRFRLEDVMEAARNEGRKSGRRAVIGEQSSVIGGQGTERAQGA